MRRRDGRPRIDEATRGSTARFEERIRRGPCAVACRPMEDRRDVILAHFNLVARCSRRTIRSSRSTNCARSPGWYTHGLRRRQGNCAVKINAITHAGVFPVDAVEAFFERARNHCGVTDSTVPTGGHGGTVMQLEKPSNRRCVRPDSMAGCFSTFHHRDPMAYNNPRPRYHQVVTSRRWFYFDPGRAANRSSCRTVSNLRRLDPLPGIQEWYLQWTELHAQLKIDPRRAATEDRHAVLADVNNIPYVSDSRRRYGRAGAFDVGSRSSPRPTWCRQFEATSTMKPDSRRHLRRPVLSGPGDQGRGLRR